MLLKFLLSVSLLTDIGHSKAIRSVLDYSPRRSLRQTDIQNAGLSMETAKSSSHFLTRHLGTGETMIQMNGSKRGGPITEKWKESSLKYGERRC
jgi:hypothetical protein